MKNISFSENCDEATEQTYLIEIFSLNMVTKLKHLRDFSEKNKWNGNRFLKVTLYVEDFITKHKFFWQIQI